MIGNRQEKLVKIFQTTSLKLLRLAESSPSLMLMLFYVVCIIFFELLGNFFGTLLGTVGKLVCHIFGLFRFLLGFVGELSGNSLGTFGEPVQHFLDTFLSFSRHFVGPFKQSRC